MRTKLLAWKLISDKEVETEKGSLFLSHKSHLSWFFKKDEEELISIKTNLYKRLLLFIKLCCRIIIIFFITAYMRNIYINVEQKKRIINMKIGEKYLN